MTTEEVEEVLALIDFRRDEAGNLRVVNVKGDVDGLVLGHVGIVEGNVLGSVNGSVGANVNGSIGGSVAGDVVGYVFGDVVGYGEGRELYSKRKKEDE